MPERRRIRNKSGERTLSKTYAMRFTAPGGTRRKLYLTTTRRKSEAFERRVLDLVAHANSGTPLGADLAQWVSALNSRYRKWFAAWGMIDERSTVAPGSIDQLVDAWEAALEARALTKQYLTETLQRVRYVITELGVKRWTDVHLQTAQEFLAGRCKGSKGWGVARHNHHVQSLRGFSKWLARERLIPENRLDALNFRSKGSEKPRHPRRAGTMCSEPVYSRRHQPRSLRVLTLRHCRETEREWTREASC